MFRKQIGEDWHFFLGWFLNFDKNEFMSPTCNNSESGSSVPPLFYRKYKIIKGDNFYQIRMSYSIFFCFIKTHLNNDLQYSIQRCQDFIKHHRISTEMYLIFGSYCWFVYLKCFGIFLSVTPLLTTKQKKKNLRVSFSTLFL